MAKSYHIVMHDRGNPIIGNAHGLNGVRHFLRVWGPRFGGTLELRKEKPGRYSIYNPNGVHVGFAG